MARRQSDELTALLIAELGIVLDEHSAYRLSDERRKGCFNLTRVAGAKKMELQPKGIELEITNAPLGLCSSSLAAPFSERALYPKA